MTHVLNNIKKCENLQAYTEIRDTEQLLSEAQIADDNYSND